MDDTRTLFVGNLGSDITEALLRELFLQAGPIEKVRLVVINGTPKPFAHIVYFHESSVQYATQIFRGTKLHRRELLLQQNNTGRDSGQSHYAPHVNHPRDERNEYSPRMNHHHYRDERSNETPPPRGSYYRNETPPPRGNYYREGRNDHPYRDERNERSRGHHRDQRNERNERPRAHQHRDERNERPSHGYHQTKYTYG